MNKLFETVVALIRLIKYRTPLISFKFPQPASTKLRILGNGKSLNEIENTLHETGYSYMVVNRHVLAENYKTIKPSYYVLADPHFFNTSEGLSILERINNDTTWNMTLFIPYTASKLRFETNEYINLCYYSNLPIYGFSKFKYFIYDKKWGLPSLTNVINGSLMIAIWMGYKEIELFGVEHSWTKSLFVNDNNELCLVNDHCYDKKQVDVKRVTDIQDGQYFSIAKALYRYSRMFQSYWDINEFAQYKGVSIWNCTKNSFIDAFPKKILN